MGRKFTVTENVVSNQGSGWIECSKFNSNTIASIPDPTGGRIQTLLTGIPSPFARMHLFKTAFEFVNNSQSIYGDSIYHKLVSECFDVFEIIASIDIFGQDLEILKYSIEEELNSLSDKSEHQSLKDVLKLYFESDYYDLTNLYLILYKNKIIGGSSPFTFFFSAPEVSIDLLSQNGKKFFSDITPLNERPEYVQEYIHGLFYENSQLKNDLPDLFIYCSNSLKEKNISNKILNMVMSWSRNGYNLNGKALKDNYDEPVVIQNTSLKEGKSVPPPPDDLQIKTKFEFKQIPLVYKDGYNFNNELDKNFKLPENIEEDIFKRNIKGYGDYPYIIADDFLENSLIELEYPINDDYFYSINLENKGFLIPIKQQYFQFIEIEQLKNNLKIEKVSNGYLVELKVELKNTSYITLKKYYYTNPTTKQYGQLLKYDFTVAIFPFVNSTAIDLYNIMLVDHDRSGLNQQYDAKLDFYSNNLLISRNENKDIKVTEYKRNSKQGEKLYSTINYKVHKTKFDFISFEITQSASKGLIIPNWRSTSDQSKVFNFAIDFGTTNTFIALKEGDNKPTNFRIGENELQTISIEKPRNNSNNTLSEKYYDVRNKLNYIISIREFLPSIIGEGESPIFNTPFRTAVCEHPIKSGETFTMLNNINIDFGFEILPLGEYKIATNLKWNLDGNKNNNQDKVREFILQILHMLKAKVLLNNGDLSATTVSYFLPLSLSSFSKQVFNDIWKNEFNKVFPSGCKLISLTESEAPFYYHNSTDMKVHAANPFLCIDIGGGSTDIAFFIDGKLKHSTSFNFAGNSLWSIDSNKLDYKNTFLENFKTELKDKGRLSQNDVLKEYLLKSNNYSDFTSLLFRYKESGFTEHLYNDKTIRFILLFHFAAIIYHTAQILKIKATEPPQFLCFSGKGSLYIQLFKSKENYEKIINIIFEYVTQKESKVKVLESTNAKESTSYGGLYIDTPSGITNNLILELEKLNISNYNIKNLDNEIVHNDVLNDLKDFINLFEVIESKIKLESDLNIMVSISEIKKHYLENIDNLYKNSFNDYKKLNSELKTSLFFLPLTRMVIELTNFLVKD